MTAHLPGPMYPRPSQGLPPQQRLWQNVVVSRTRFTRAWAWECLDCGDHGIVRPVRMEDESLLDYGNRGKRAKRQCERLAAAHRCKR